MGRMFYKLKSIYIPDQNINAGVIYIVFIVYVQDEVTVILYTAQCWFNVVPAS